MIEEGYYYDVDFKDSVFIDVDLEKVEKMMKKLSEENYLIECIEVFYDEVRDIFKYDLYKLELIEVYKDD